MPSHALVIGAMALAIASTAAQLPSYCGTCQSFGVDFLDQGSYFQDSTSTNNFTAVQEFRGCDSDVSNNILVLPNGDQLECGDTPISPDDTLQPLSCPITKNQLTSGDYSLLVISNNGQCNPIDYMREFHIDVGTQTTTTVSPTIIITVSSTPIVNTTVTVDTTITSTAPPSTTFTPSATICPTITVHPVPVITVVQAARRTITLMHRPYYTVVATQTKSVSPSCVTPRGHAQKADPRATIKATIPIRASVGRRAEPTPAGRSGSTEFKRAIIAGRAVAPEVKAAFLAERSARLASSHEKRSPDDRTVRFTDLQATSTVSVYTTSTLPPSTFTGTTTLVHTFTTTPTITVKSGVYVTATTVTAPRQTVTKTYWVPVSIYVAPDATVKATLTVTRTSANPAAVTSCARQGGKLVYSS